jgi:hypothetical protein
VGSKIKTAFPVKQRNRAGYFTTQSTDGVSEYWQVRQFLEGKDWDEITAEDLRNEYEGDEQAILAFLSAEGFRYYLPTFLSIALDVLEQRPAFVGSILFYLTPSNDPEEAERDIDRYAGFNADQREAIRAWLGYINEKKAAVTSYSLRPEVALARYWSS